MKNNNYKKVFLDELKEQKFVSEKYRKAIESELNDHFEDLKYDLICSGLNESDAEKEALKRIGSPTKIVNTLNYYMKDSKFYICFETFILSIITAPLYYIIFHIASNLLFPIWHIKLSLAIILFIEIILFSPIAFLINHLVTKWKYNLLVKKEIFLNIVLYIFPIIIMHVFLHKIYKNNPELYLRSSGDNFSKMLLYIFIIVILNLGLIKFYYREITSNKKIKLRRQMIIKKILGILINIYVFLDLILVFTKFSNSKYILTIFEETDSFPIYIIDQFWSSKNNIFILNFIYLAILILCLKNLYKYYKTKQKREFPYFAFAAGLYLISMILISPDYKENIELHPPAIHIPTNIENNKSLLNAK